MSDRQAILGLALGLAVLAPPVADAEWYDIGTPMEYERAAAAFERAPERFGAEPEELPEVIIAPVALNGV